MKKISLHQHEDVDRALGRPAADEGPSNAELVRRGLTLLATRAERPRPTAIGFSDDGPTDLAANMERYLHNPGFAELARPADRPRRVRHDRRP
jgi:hypothetical protein